MKALLRCEEPKIIVKCYGDASGRVGDASIHEGIAGENISPFIVVKKGSDNKLYAASNTDTSIQDIVGVSLISANADGRVTYTMAREISDASFSMYTPNSPLYMNDIGKLVETPPIIGWWIQIGSVISSGRIKVLVDAAKAHLLK